MPIFTVTAVEFDFTDSEGELPFDQQQKVVNDTLLTLWPVDKEEDLVDEISDSTGWCIKNIEYCQFKPTKAVVYKELVEIDGTRYEIKACDYTDTVKEWMINGILPEGASNHAIVEYVSEDVKESDMD